MSKKNILLIYGGGGTEHEVSVVSANYLKDKLAENYNVLSVEIGKDQKWRLENNQQVELKNATLANLPIDFAIPCIHGPPGENGEIQQLFEQQNLPYLGCGPKASADCFNKLITKNKLIAAGVPVVEYCELNDVSDDRQEVDKLFDKYQAVFIKAASQGSSVGCYYVQDKNEVESKIQEAFQYSNQVLVERPINGRELEVSAYEYDGKIQASQPGEIVCPSKFYDYTEKYSNQSKTTTHTFAPGLSQEQIAQFYHYSIEVFKKLGLRHLSRIDYFLTPQGEILLNEINTFPGMTPISMFPKMLEANGHVFSQFLSQIIEHNAP